MHWSWSEPKLWDRMGKCMHHTPATSLILPNHTLQCPQPPYPNHVFFTCAQLHLAPPTTTPFNCIPGSRKRSLLIMPVQRFTEVLLHNQNQKHSMSWTISGDNLSQPVGLILIKIPWITKHTERYKHYIFLIINEYMVQLNSAAFKYTIRMLNEYGKVFRLLLRIMPAFTFALILCKRSHDFFKE